MKVQKRFYYVGIYDSSHFEKWPWFFESEGTFLSEKGRVCKIGKAIRKQDRKEAVEAYDSWLKAKPSRHKYKLHIVECIEWTEDPAVKPYPDGHPLIEVMASDLRFTYKHTALDYFFDRNKDIEFHSDKTRKKHRKLLLDRFGFDIDEPLPEDEVLKPIKRHIDDPFNEASKLKAVK